MKMTMTKDIKTTELIRTSQSWDGAMLPDFPQGQPELRVVRLDFPIGAKTGWHHHSVVNYGIVQQGDLTIVCQDGTEKTFHEGEALVEVIGTIHRGENRGSKPVILNMFYFSSPGAEITIQHPSRVRQQGRTDWRQAVSKATCASALNDTNTSLVCAVGMSLYHARKVQAEIGVLWEFWTSYIEGIESVCAIGAVLEQVFLGLSEFLPTLVLAEAVSATADPCGLQGKD